MKLFAALATLYALPHVSALLRSDNVVGDNVEGDNVEGDVPRELAYVECEDCYGSSSGPCKAADGVCHALGPHGECMPATYPCFQKCYYDKDCKNLDTQCTDYYCKYGKCVGYDKPKLTKCYDDDKCTYYEYCDGYGECKFKEKDCSVKDKCKIGYCDPYDGECKEKYKDCSYLDDDCNDGECNIYTGECEKVPKKGKHYCDDYDKCTLYDYCDYHGNCIGYPKDCTLYPPEQCKEGFCDKSSGDCKKKNKKKGTECDDYDICTDYDVCKNGVCKGKPKDCSHLDYGCIIGVCNPYTGDCEEKYLDKGDPCDDYDKCTEYDYCDAYGKCIGKKIYGYGCYKH